MSDPIPLDDQIRGVEIEADLALPSRRPALIAAAATLRALRAQTPLDAMRAYGCKPGTRVPVDDTKLNAAFARSRQP